ncbi:MAG: biotin--[acetyl-CoA-carboxylase] ligase [bacterium]|nr:biotin--[acetyl-CoA-carboxylase] ligase [bacterium]
MKAHKETPVSLADRLLEIIRTRSKGLTLTYLSRKLKRNPEELVSCIKQLKEWGYRTDYDRSSGKVILVSAPDILSSTEIMNGLKTRIIGRQVHGYRKVKSTNDLASRLATDGIGEGCVVAAEEQTAGRGRLGRNWHSPVGVGIYTSIILRPKLRPEQAPGLSLMTALALAITVDKLLPGKVQIKWPNDLLICGKKAAGILTELSVDRGRIDYLVVGVGINVNQTGGMFPEEIKKTATSLRRTLRKKVNRVLLLQEFLQNFEREYLQYQKYQLKKSLKKLRQYSSLLGQEVAVTSGREQIRGRAVDIDSSGALVVDTGSEILIISAGEVTLRVNA